LHAQVAPGLVRKELHAPQYTISHTEDLRCEMRRFELRAKSNKGRKRKAGTRTIDSQLLRQERVKRLSAKMGFKKRLNPPAFFANLGVVKARALTKPRSR